MSEWKRTRVGGNTQFMLAGDRWAIAKGRVLVRKVEWTRPGALRKTIQQTGWAVFVDGIKLGLAHSTATKAQQWAEQPGVWAEIKEKLNGPVVLR